MEFADRIDDFLRCPGSKIKPHPSNWRVHPIGQTDALQAILEKFGIASGNLVIRNGDGTYETEGEGRHRVHVGTGSYTNIDGHARRKIYGDDALVPIQVLDMDYAEAEAFLLVYDPVGALATADALMLDDLMNRIEFEAPAIQEMLADLAAKNAEADPVAGDEDDPGVHNSLSAERTTDLYSTPESAIAMLMRHVELPKRIWEPAAGKGAISGFLQEAGFDVSATSLETGENFLEYRPKFRFDAIVTNPPYSIKNEFIERCAAFRKPYYLLMPLAALEGERRQAVWGKSSLTIIIPNYRIEFVRFDGGLNNPNMASAWFCVDPQGEVGTRIVYAGGEA